PSPESDMAMTSIIGEDQRGRVDFSIANNHGDTDEALTAVWIKVDDAEGNGFTLFLGETELAEAGLTVVQKDGVSYYELRGENINNVYAQAGENFAGNQSGEPNPSFEVKYEITDVSNDGSQDAVTQEKSGQHTLEVTPVTDPVDLALGDVTVNGVTGSATDGFTVTQNGPISVEITLAKQADARAGTGD